MWADPTEGTGCLQFLVADEVKNVFDPKKTPAKSNKRSIEADGDRANKQAKEDDGISPTAAVAAGALRRHARELGQTDAFSPSV